VTDFLPAERARGITIQSAAITFRWPPMPSGSVSASISAEDACAVNLIDTPGHADFTFEVLRSLRVLDGAVCILDGVAGVEAQTEKVWLQAQQYSIPKIVYVNKLDRDGASFGKTVREIASKLHTWPAVCHIPWHNKDESFVGVFDVVNLQALQWKLGGDGKTITIINLEEFAKLEPEIAKEGIKARVALVELLSSHDDAMVEEFLDKGEDHMAISKDTLLAALRRCTLREDIPVAAVFAGASFKNVGVQPLLDAVTALLPSPEESQEPSVSLAGLSGGLNDLMTGKLLESGTHKSSKKGKKALEAKVQNIDSCSLAFKVASDAKRGVLVYVRVYHGSLSKGSMIFNTNLQVAERVPRLLKMYGSDAVDMDTIVAGEIGVITGLKYARTGDTLVSYTGMNPKSGPPPPLSSLQLRPIDVPPPVFFASIEPHSLKEQKPVAEALDLLLREDPSLQVSSDEESGQTLLSGMGELHLEIARDRLIGDFKAKASMGKIEIGYRECLTTPASDELLFEREIAGRLGKAGCAVSVSPILQHEDGEVLRDGNSISVTIDEEAVRPLLAPEVSLSEVRTALENGALAALGKGPRHSFALHSTTVDLTIGPRHLFGPDTTVAAISSAARLATQGAIKKSSQEQQTVLMEPVMHVTISLDEQSLGSVVHDLTAARGAQIISFGNTDTEVSRIDPKLVYAPPDSYSSSDMLSSINEQRNVVARVPLKEMVGYLKHLRSLTGGRGTFVMSVDRFEKMGSQREKALLKEMRGGDF
jgi:elongation factor G